MKFINIINDLKTASVHFDLICSAPETEISGIQYYDHQKSPESDILYIMFEASMIEDISRTPGVWSLLLLSRDHFQVPQASGLRFNIISEKKSHNFTTLINSIQHLLANDYHLNRKTNEIMDAVIQNESIYDVFEKIYQYANNPIIFIDSSDTVAIAKPTGFIDTHRDQIPSLEEFTALLLEIRKKGAISEEPFVFTEHKSHQIMACNIIQENYSVGTLLMIEYFSPFTDSSLKELHFIQKILTHYLTTSQTYNHIGEDSVSLLLSNLIQTESYAPIMLERLLNAMRFSTQSGMRFIILKFRTRPSNYDFDKLIHDIKKLLPDTLYTIMDNSVILLTGNCDKEFEKKILSVLISLHQNHNITIGISNCFYDLKEFHKYYQQAWTSQTYCAKISDPQYRYYVIYENIAQLELLHLLKKHADPVDFASPDIIRLIKYDAEHRTQLSQTLSVYLNCFGDVILTASKLNFHKNTLYYRLNQIKDILNNDLTDGETNYQYMFSFRVLQYLGQFYPLDL